MNRRRWLEAWMRAVVAVVVASLTMAVAPAGAALAGTASGATLAWRACPGVDDTRLRCATVEVPLDHARPAGPRIDIMISRLAATDPALRRGVLVTTGGGPGGAGVPEPLNLAAVVDPAVLARYDIVGFDMRFVERSTPITCGQPEEEPGGYWVRTATYQSLEDTAVEAREYARACARHAGWALPFATTAQAARDMDAIRAVLGERKLSFLGGSYAAMLGVAYGTLFPHRADRFVLDSPVDLDLAWRPYELERLPAFEDNYAAFTGYLADNDATFGLGGTPTEVAQTLSGAFAEAALDPIVAGDHAWTAGELGSLTVIATYFEQFWPVVATDLAAILAHIPPPIPLDPRPAPLPGTPGVPADNHTAVNMAFRCGDDAWPRDLATYRRDLNRLGTRHPVFGPSIANVNPCAFWPVSRDNTPPLVGNRAPAALVVAALRDASVPPANSIATARAITGSRLVTVDKQTHVPLLSGQANACLTGTVTAYLVHGQLPRHDTAC
ncbi:MULTISPECIES: alpha/beta fold hydrolase [unclassified Micromonospora]|uniref:alpha/beta fold hydrolase n=1 Tax=unclassified Micromonospora TaxID=2617518 RepID=UPI001C600EE6|nr:alpha/beta fold hydrolase [Micromonospora sp. RL09-050-HVF-A]MBW4701971.1 alpha/beta fold hydrolase [Micromonospora sp. RL09-050-HVF-A]